MCICNDLCVVADGKMSDVLERLGVVKVEILAYIDLNPPIYHRPVHLTSIYCSAQHAAGCGDVFFLALPRQKLLRRINKTVFSLMFLDLLVWRCYFPGAISEKAEFLFLACQVDPEIGSSKYIKTQAVMYELDGETFFMLNKTKIYLLSQTENLWYEYIVAVWHWIAFKFPILGLGGF